MRMLTLCSLFSSLCILLLWSLINEFDGMLNGMEKLFSSGAHSTVDGSACCFIDCTICGSRLRLGISFPFFFLYSIQIDFHYHFILQAHCRVESGALRKIHFFERLTNDGKLNTDRRSLGSLWASNYCLNRNGIFILIGTFFLNDKYNGCVGCVSSWFWKLTHRHYWELPRKKKVHLNESLFECYCGTEMSSITYPRCAHISCSKFRNPHRTA